MTVVDKFSFFPLRKMNQIPAGNSPLLFPYLHPGNQPGSPETYSLAPSHTSICHHAVSVFALVQHLDSYWRYKVYFILTETPQISLKK